MYEMLAGAPPFTAPSRETLLVRHALDPVPPLRTVRGGVTVAAQEVIGKALAKSAADRYATAGAFVTALEKAFASRRTWTRRQVGAAVTLAVAGVIAGWLLWPRSPLEARRGGGDADGGARITWPGR